MDLPKFREKLKEYRDRIGLSQEALADAVYVNKGVLSEILNGKRMFPPGLVHRIVQFLAKHEAILGQSQAYELLKLTDTKDFSEADWNAPPLADLAPEPSPIASPLQRFQDEVPRTSSGETVTSSENPVGEKQDDKPQTNAPVQNEGQTRTQTGDSEGQEQVHSQIEGSMEVRLIQLPGLQNLHFPPKNRLEAAYRQLMIIVEARFQFAGVTEALRKFPDPIAYESLSQAKKALDEAEADFHEDGVRHTLALLDNNKVWPHYIMGNAAFEKHKERTRDLVEKALAPRSPLSQPVLNLNILLAGDRWNDPDPRLRKLYDEMYREFNAMLKAMNRRLRL